MYLNEAKSEQEKRDLAMIIEEVLEQRYQGVKNEKGVWVTPALSLIHISIERRLTDESNWMVLDAPLLYESGLDAVCYQTWLVVAPEHVRRARIMARDGLDAKQAQMRIDAQIRQDVYKRQTLDTLAVIVITLILSYFTLVFGELVPKRIAMQRPLQVARISVGIVSALAVVMKPVIWFLAVSTNAILRLLHMKTEAERCV